MNGLWWKTLLKWMIWGYHYFWKHPKSGSNPSSSPRRSCPRSVNSAGSPSRSASGSGEAGASGRREELPAPLVTRFESSFPGGVRATTELSWRIHKGGFCFFVASHGRSHGKRGIEGNKNELEICGNSKCLFFLMHLIIYIQICSIITPFFHRNVFLGVSLVDGCSVGNWWVGSQHSKHNPSAYLPLFCIKSSNSIQHKSNQTHIKNQ